MSIASAANSAGTIQPLTKVKGNLPLVKLLRNNIREARALSLCIKTNVPSIFSINTHYNLHPIHKINPHPKNLIQAMDPNQRIISLSSDSDQSNVWNPTYPETQKRPTKSPFAFSSDEESDEEVTSPTPAQAPRMQLEDLNWMSYFPPSTSMPFYEPGVPMGTYFPSQLVEDENEEEALEIPPLAIVYPGEEIPSEVGPSEVGCSKKSSSKKSKKAKPVKPPKTGRGKGKKMVE